MPRRGGENPAIERRRQADATQMAMNATQQSDFRRSYISDWQAKSTIKMEQVQIANIAKNLEQDAQKQLDARRQKLAELLLLEEEQYRYVPSLPNYSGISSLFLTILTHNLTIASNNTSIISFTSLFDHALCAPL